MKERRGRKIERNGGRGEESDERKERGEEDKWERVMEEGGKRRGRMEMKSVDLFSKLCKIMISMLREEGRDYSMHVEDGTGMILDMCSFFKDSSVVSFAVYKCQMVWNKAQGNAETAVSRRWHARTLFFVLLYGQTFLLLSW